MVAHLGVVGGDAHGMRQIAKAFAAANPGYSVEWLPDVRRVAADRRSRILFVQDGQAQVEVLTASGSSASALGVGDLVVQRPEAEVVFDAPVGLLAFTLPDVPPTELPLFVRPDWDPRITDTPGGCAQQTGAYRRILLTWKREVGPYAYQALNAHRVRITDSFTHYHPIAGGFDEFYLVQMVQPGAHLLTSDQVERIERRQIDTRSEAEQLMTALPLQVGDLVYLPRGLAHRGRGGALAQVITVPGFVPGREIGIDHHLRAIDERFGGGAVPFHEPASHAPVVR